MKFCFGDIVVIDEDQIGVIVKEWNDIQNNNINYDVYVRSYNGILNYKENQIERYMIRHKYLNDEEKEYQEEAIRPSNKIEFDTKEYQNKYPISMTQILYSKKDLNESEEPIRSRIYNCLSRSRIYTLDDFFKLLPTQVKRLHQLGNKSMKLLIDILTEYCEANNIIMKYTKEDYYIFID